MLRTECFGKKERDRKMIHKPGPVLCLFYCQNTPKSGEKDRQALEKKYGKDIHLYPMPCSGRVETLHVLRSLEEFADAVYVLTCPQGSCRYFEGNRKAKKRVEAARSILEAIGMKRERVGTVFRLKDDKRTLEQHVDEIKRIIKDLPPSPVHGEEGAGVGEAFQEQQ
jgi:F420-non-reducing hydrogenase iron-sulfur subunit